VRFVICKSLISLCALFCASFCARCARLWISHCKRLRSVVRFDVRANPATTPYTLCGRFRAPRRRMARGAPAPRAASPWQAQRATVAMTAPRNVPPLRDRLLAFRADILRRLDEADLLEPGWLNSLAGVAAALDGLDALGLAEVEIAERAVVADDGASLRLALYTGDRKAVAVELSPVHAVTLATRLIEAALPRLR
jgi:hypothetical protein